MPATQFHIRGRMSIDAQSAKSSPATLDRPFYFMVVLWGERFRNYFLDYCLASALSPGNIPALEPYPAVNS